MTDKKLSNELTKYYKNIWKNHLDKVKKIFDKYLPYKIIKENESKAIFRERKIQAGSKKYYSDFYFYRTYLIPEDEYDFFIFIFKSSIIIKMLEGKSSSWDFNLIINDSSKIDNMWKIELKFGFYPELTKDFYDVEVELIKKTESLDDPYGVSKIKPIKNINKSKVIELAIDDVMKTGILKSIAYEIDPKIKEKFKERGFETFENLSDVIIKKYQKVVNLIATKWGISIEDLISALEKSDKVNAYIKNQIDSMHILSDDNKSKERDLIINLVKSRLPRFIYAVVKDIPIKFYSGSSKKFLAYYHPSNNSILVYWTSGVNLDKFMETLAHEYWHGFEYNSGFKNNIKEKFQKIVDKVGRGENAYDDLSTVIEIIDYYGGEDLKSLIDKYWKRWTTNDKEYFNKQQEYEALNKIAKEINNPNLYKEMGEMLAETLAAIVMQKPIDAPSQSILVWMNKKFSNKSSVKKIENFIMDIITSQR